MAGIVATIANWIGGLVEWLKCWFNGDWIFCGLFNLFFDLLSGGVTILVGALAWVPVPVELQGFVWPDPGPLGGLLLETGVAQAVGILAAALTTKFLLRLIPLVRL